eukprot:TRINITY_DN889_c0_g1_i3.p1 TRINITY_DN889_c0_g1~~TRINITY_DN889_c0_g1_i3.p1  ORF type:complete len:649 (+),score=173.48 TRINITY_DN889_c0_g1_i3:83-1948(+)
MVQDVHAAPYGGEKDDVRVSLDDLHLVPGLSPDAAAKASLAWRDLSVVVGEGTPDRKVVLEPTSGAAQPGELVAVMGPSGAGKSCFLNALAGRSPGVSVQGEIAANGCVINSEGRRRMCAYVMQDDALLTTQTPREILDFSAALRLGLPPGPERDQLVNETLLCLGLGKCADSPVGSAVEADGQKRVSGGEKKRTAIAQELLSRPGVLFLDEPTSGLDSWNAMHLVQMLKQLAAAGCLVMCTIHQPSSEVFALFDRVILLASGSTIYDGAVADLNPHLAAHGHQMQAHSNPADFVMLLLQKTPAEELLRLRSVPDAPPPGKQQDDAGSEAAQCYSQKTGCLTQMGYLLRRQVRHMIRERTSIVARIGSTIFLNTIGGCIFFRAGSEWGTDSDSTDIAAAVQNHFGALVFFCINTMFLNAQPPLMAFIPERPVFTREYASGTYGVVAYMLSKILLEIPIVAIAVGCGLALNYNLSELQGSFGLLYITAVAFSLAASSLAFCLGTVTPNSDTAVALLPLLLVPQILFSGFFSSNEAMPVWIRWAQYTCTMKYAINLFLLIEFDHDAVPANRVAVTDALLDRTEVSNETGSWVFYYGMLVGVSIVLRLVATLLLHLRARSSYGQ